MQIRIFLFMKLFSFWPSQIGRHLMVVVVGYCEIAREIDFDSVPLADGHRGHDVEEFVENLCRRLRGALRESLAQEIGTGFFQRACSSALRDRADCSNRE